MKTILITGASGFIGKELVNELIKEDIKLILLSRSFNLSNENEKKCIYYNLDLLDYIELESVFKRNKKIDLVVHLAALAHKKGSKKISESDFYLNNVVASQNIFKLCTKYQTPIFFASSVEVYGDIDDNKNIKENSILNPISAYAKSKKEAEDELKEIFNENLELDYTIARFGMVYGENMKKDLYKRIFLIKDKLMYKIPRVVIKHHFVSVKNVIEFIKFTIYSNETKRYTINLVDKNPVNISTLINFENNIKKNNVIPLPQCLFIKTEKVISMVNASSNFSYNLKKIYDPPTYCNEEIQKKISLDWNVENTIYNK